jgi:hypothetical protein
MLRQEKATVFDILLHYPFNIDQLDSVTWSSGLFSVHSMHMFLNFRGVKISLVGSV